MRITLGLDLGIKTGSLVKIEVNKKYDAIESYEELFVWTNGPSTKDPLLSIAQFFERHVLSEIAQYTTYGKEERADSVAIDWNQKEIYWAANKAQSNVKTFIAGYLFAKIYNYGLTPRFISPALVREFLCFPSSKAKKEEVQRHFITKAPIILAKDCIPMSSYADHSLDAFILAYIIDLQGAGRPCPETLRHPKAQW